jgi:hypothetical protein
LIKYFGVVLLTPTSIKIEKVARLVITYKKMYTKEDVIEPMDESETPRRIKPV